MPPKKGKMDDTIVDKVLETIDAAGLNDALACKIAAQLSENIQLDDLVKQLLKRKQERLTALLAEQLLAKLSDS
jgi:hypothetical protein